MSMSKGGRKIGSIFFTIAIVITVVIASVVGTTSFIEMRSGTELSEEFVADMARLESTLVADNLAGAVKFGKVEPIQQTFYDIAHDSQGQVIGTLAMSADGAVLAVSEDGRQIEAELVELAEQALASGEIATAQGGHWIAVPIRYGANNDVIGVISNAWSPEFLQERFTEKLVFALLMAGLASVLAIAAALFVFGRLIVRPLTQSRKAIVAISDSDYSVEISGEQRNDEIGDINRAVSVLRDKLAKAHAGQEEALFKSTAFMGCNSSIMIVDPDLVIRHANDKMYELFDNLSDAMAKMAPKLDIKNLVGQSAGVFHKNTQNIRSLLENQGGKPLSTIIKFGESRISLTISAIDSEDGVRAGYVLEWADITTNWYNGAVIDAIDANQMKADFDISGAFIAANAPFLEAVEASQDSLNGTKLSGIATPTDSGMTIDAVTRTVLESGAFAGKIKFQSKNGPVICSDGSLTCVRDHTGKPIRFLWLGRDVTTAENEIEAARVQRREAERNQTEVVEALRVGLSKLSGGDLTASIDKPFSGTYEELRGDYNRTVETLANALGEIAKNAENIHNEASEISSTADGLSRRTESTAATLEQTAAALDELTSSVNAAASGAARADEAVTAAKANAEDSGKVVLDTVSAMDQIAESSDRITSIIKVIDDIAFQTNLLALNAGVEAARAGDAGRGFAVVASEVRALAQRSSDAAREINDLIAKSGTQVKTGVDLVGRTGKALQQIVESVSEISSLVSDIATSSRQQSASLSEINSSVADLDQSTQQNAARLEETTAASESLRNDSVKLVDTVSHFKISSSTRETNGVVSGANRQPRDTNRSGHEASETRAPAPKRVVGAQAASAQWEDF